MHKEVYLPTSANYAGMELQIDALARQASEPVSQIIAVATSFGRAVVANRVPPEDAETWALGLQHQANDHRYYELTHDALGAQFEHYYLLLQDHSGKTRAIQPFLMVNQDLMTGMPKAFRRVMDKVRQRFPSALVMRMLMVGCSAGEGHLVRDRSTGGVEWVAQALSEALHPVARGFKAAMVVMKDFPKTYRKALRPMRKAGYARVPSMPGSRLDLNFKNFDDYLQTKLSHKTRKNLRSKFRKADAGAPLTMQVVTDVAPHIDEIFPLYQQVLERSQYKFEELTKPYFVQISQRMGERALFFIWRQNGKAVAFSSCAGHEGVLRDHYIGLDYKVALESHLYFVTFRDIVTWAIENKYHTYYSAPLNYEPKYHLRHDLVPLDLYVRASWNWINPIFRFVVPYLEPTRYDPMIRKFANAHELW
ncbi:MAG TPA: GNAT family N-acetyltransferase [Candidatus Methylacidiphilales bacterium]